MIQTDPKQSTPQLLRQGWGWGCQRTVLWVLSPASALRSLFSWDFYIRRWKKESTEKTQIIESYWFKSTLFCKLKNETATQTSYLARSMQLTTCRELRAPAALLLPPGSCQGSRSRKRQTSSYWAALLRCWHLSHKYTPGLTLST